jgi:exonuclease III
MRLVSWNILHGAGSRRTPLVALRLCDLAPDLVVLTEFRRTTGGQIAGVLHDRGLVHQLSTEPPAGRNGVFIASRTPLTAGDPGPDAWARHRWLDVGLPALGATLTAIHAPDTHRSDAAGIQRQAAFWQHLVRLCRARRSQNHMVAGDLNTGRSGLDGAGERFTGTVFLGRISTLGYRDAFRLGQPRAAAPTWFSHTGAGVRIDAVWMSDLLVGQVQNAWHDGSARSEKESDHAPVVVDLRGVPGRPDEASGRVRAKNTAKRAVRALAQPNLVR